MNDQTEVLPAPLQEDSFDVVLRGYSRGQVDEYVRRTRRQLEELQTRVHRADREADDVRLDRDRARNELAAAHRKLESREPSYEDLGERLTQILRLAQEEAAERRSEAQTDADRIRTDAEEAVRDINRDVEEKRSSAEGDAERLRAEAREEAERVRSEAEDSAERARREAQEQADQVVAEAEQRRRELEQYAKERVERLEEQRTQLVGELSSVRDSLQTLLPAQALAARQAGGADTAAAGSADPDAAGKSSEEAAERGSDEPASPVGVEAAEEPDTAADPAGEDGVESTTEPAGGQASGPVRRASSQTRYL